jgi:hypothetical protein
MEIIMAARESPQIIEEERERGEATPIVEVLRRAHRGPGGGECLAGEYLPIAF